MFCVCISTCEQCSFDRRIKVFVVRNQSLELVAETDRLFGGSLFCMTAFNDMLLAGHGYNFVIFKWDSVARTLQRLYQHQAAGHQQYASCLQCMGNSVFGGTVAQLLHFEVHYSYCT